MASLKRTQRKSVWKQTAKPAGDDPPHDSVPPRILLVHGFGEPVSLEKWSKPWEKMLRKRFAKYFPAIMKRGIEFPFASYHELFEEDFNDEALDPKQLTAALGTLGWTGMHKGIGGLLRGSGGLDAMVEALHWNAGMVVRWARDPDLRARLRNRILESIEDENPSVIAAHSLGSLIAYDLFLENPEAVRDRTFISFGSQIGNAFVRNVFNGRLHGLPTARYWLHLYNPNDAVFTAEIRLHGNDTLSGSDTIDLPNGKKAPRRNFYQILTPFDNPDPLDHVAVSTGKGCIGYLDSFEALQLAWPRALGCGKQHEQIRRTIRRAVHAATNAPPNRALLIGIDQYARPDIPPLAGCVNDTYLVSQILQEAEFPVEHIRMLHNDRATAANIRDRLAWLLDDVSDGDFRFLFVSCHGHQLESYGAGETADRLDECLCPYDYEYSVESAILDDHLYNLYAQLPQKSQFVVVLDCCHSGGMARAGNARIRGLTSPMDVAHRGLIWDPGERNGSGYWLRRSLSPKSLVKNADKSEFIREKNDFKVNAELPSSVHTARDKAGYVGRDGTTRRLFRALSLRQKKHSVPKEGRPGPYMPVILQACEENDVALEHTDGMSTHGAFTFCLARIFRENRALDPSAPLLRDWSNTLRLTSEKLRDLGYVQKPQLLTPTAQDRIAFNPDNRI